MNTDSGNDEWWSAHSTAGRLVRPIQTCHPFTEPFMPDRSHHSVGVLGVAPSAGLNRTNN